MRYSGLILQIIAVMTVIIGVLAGFAEMVSDAYPTTGGIILVSALVGGILLFGIGGVFRTLADIAIDVRRTADASERTAEASVRRVEALVRLASPHPGTITPIPDVERPRQKR